jgi:predicted Na+-dependent transporter
LLFIISGISALPRGAISASVALTTLALGLLLHALFLSIGKLSGSILGAQQPERRALMFCTAQRSFVFNILLCGHVFHGNSRAFGFAVLPGIIYYLIALTVDSIIAQWCSAHTPEMVVLTPAYAHNTVERANQQNLPTLDLNKS